MSNILMLAAIISGAGLGSVLKKLFNCCIALWAMYPINKFIIMRKSKPAAEDE